MIVAVWTSKDTQCSSKPYLPGQKKRHNVRCQPCSFNFTGSCGWLRKCCVLYVTRRLHYWRTFLVAPRWRHARRVNCWSSRRTSSHACVRESSTSNSKRKSISPGNLMPMIVPDYLMRCMRFKSAKYSLVVQMYGNKYTCTLKVWNVLSAVWWHYRRLELFHPKYWSEQLIRDMCFEAQIQEVSGDWSGNSNNVTMSLPWRTFTITLSMY